MGNSHSQDHQSPLVKETSDCKQRQELLKQSEELRRKFAFAQLNCNVFHEEIADVLHSFIEQQKSKTPQVVVVQQESPKRKPYTVQLPEEDEEDDIIEEEESSLNTRRQVPRQMPCIDNIAQERMDNDDSKLLQALEDVEKEFRNIYQLGKDKLYEKLETTSITNKPMPLQPSKLVRALSRSRSSKNHHGKTFEASEKMGIAIERLELWEEKLYADYKEVMEATRSADKSKTNAEWKEVSTIENPGIEVKIVCARFYKEKLNEVRETLLVPTIVEQLRGLKENWEAMSKSYENQKKIISEVKVEDSPPLLCDMEHQQAAKALQKKLKEWHPKFKSYIHLQCAYIKPLYYYCWLSTSLEGESKFNKMAKKSRGTQKNGKDNNADRTCYLMELQNKTKNVTAQMKGFQKKVKALRTRQKKEHEQRAEINRLENRVKNKDERLNQDGHDKESLMEEIEKLEERIKIIKEVLKTKTKTTQEAVNELFKGFSGLFKVLEEFSREAAKIYEKLIKQNPQPVQQVALETDQLQRADVNLVAEESTVQVPHIADVVEEILEDDMPVAVSKSRPKKQKKKLHD